MAEALLARFGRPDFDALSAGTRPRRVHPLAVRALAEVGIDWHAARAKSVTELVDRRFDYVITLSNSAREECPSLPGPHSSLHWHLEDPSTIEGSEERRIEAFRATRTELTTRLRPFIEIARRAAGLLPAVAGPEPRSAGATA
jgi:arsenate reductase